MFHGVCILSFYYLVILLLSFDFCCEVLRDYGVKRYENVSFEGTLDNILTFSFLA